MKLPVSLIVITYNEEANIQRCIQSVPWASEVIVLDSESTDRTREISKSLGAVTQVQKFLGFRDQKQKATDLASFEWVLNLDADEVLSKELSEEIQKSFNSGLKYDGYYLPRLSFHLGRWIRHGGWHPDYQLRLFNKNHARWVGGNIHERVQAEKVGYLQNNILHYVFKDLTHQVAVNNKYSSLGAKDLFEKGTPHSLIKQILKPISKFFELYFFKRGFLDGFAGFVIAVGGAYSVFIKYAKLKELEDPKFRNQGV